MYIHQVVNIALSLTLLFTPQTIKTAQIEEIPPYPMPNTSIVEVVNKLAICESGGDPTAINWDDGGSPSYSILQFKKGTFRHFVDRYDLLPNAEEAEWENFLMDGEFQRYLAYRMIEEDKDALRHWTNCSKKLKLL